MTNNEIIEILHTAVNYTNCKDFRIGNIGKALSADEVDYMKKNPEAYHIYYHKMRKLIESLPWISVKDKMPDCKGDYLTLLDCNEHMIVNNTYNNAYSNTWDTFRTHVCYWMPIPKKNDNEIAYVPSKMDWHDGGH